MNEKILLLIKPDGVRRGLTGDVLSRIEHKGYILENLRMHAGDLSGLLDEHYAEHIDKPFYPGLKKYMTSGPIVAAVFSGARVIEGVRSLVGATDPTVAAPGTIRGDFGRDWCSGALENIVHASDSVQSAEREIKIWFS
ncbi:MAG: nucleoside-diphosphate kinase [Actinomycetaceae bacterium]|nr:nucleoside-diphosphate kinase [Actinomycetaceae bacterium]